MYSILIVDDEQIIREGLCTIVDWNSLGYFITGTAANGLDALEFIKETPVDVILADIKMPRMSGLELSSIIEREHPETRVIILSGYDNFDYARKAIRNRVFSYLLKPCREEEIEDVFSRLSDLLDKERSRDRLADTAEKNILRDELNTALTSEGKAGTPELDRWFALRENKECYIILLRIFDAELSRKNFNYFMESIEAALPGQARAVCTGTESGAAAALLQISTNSEQEPALFYKIIKSLSEKIFEGRITGGVSTEFHSTSALRQKYQEALAAENYSLYCRDGELAEPESITPRSGIPETADESSVLPSAEAVFHALSGSDADGLSEAFGSFFSLLEEQRDTGRAEIAAALEALYGRTEALLATAGFYPESALDTQGDFKAGLESCVLLEDFRDFINESISKWIEGIGKFRTGLKSPIIRKSIATLNQHYGDDISLENIADSLQVTPNYFSRLFKKETGINYKDYLLKIRMDEAKKLLKSSQDKIYEIADRVGYSDHRYFSEVFKRETGMSPKEYRSSSVHLNEVL